MILTVSVLDCPIQVLSGAVHCVFEQDALVSFILSPLMTINATDKFNAGGRGGGYPSLV